MPVCKAIPLIRCVTLTLMSVASVSAAAELRAAAARIEVTPPLLAGAQEPTGRYEHEHLYVRAIVIDNGSTRAVLIGSDQSNLNDDVWNDASRRIAKLLDCPVANILMSATHTHSPGVALGPGVSSSPNDKRVIDAMVEGVRQASLKLQPARVSFGTGTAYLNVNRDAIDSSTHLWTQAPNVLAASDKTVAVLKFESLSAEPIAVYVNYAMHPINGYLANFTSADFAGAMSRYVEQAYGDKATVVFTQGASGDQNPLYMRAATNGLASRSGTPITGDVLVREVVEAPLRDGKLDSRPMDPIVRERLERWMESEGEVLGEEVIRVMSSATHPESNIRISGSSSVLSCPGRTRTDKGREGMTASYVDGPPVPIRIGLIGIGDVALTWVDAEIYSLISQRLKRQSPLTNTVMVTLANGKSPSGYIPDDASFSHNTFQVLASSLRIGCAEASIADGLTKLVAAYQNQR